MREPTANFVNHRNNTRVLGVRGFNPDFLSGFTGSRGFSLRERTRLNPNDLRLTGWKTRNHRGVAGGVNRTPVAQVRGVLADRVVVSTTLDLFLTLGALASYSGLSVRKLRDLLGDPVHPLPHYRIGGKILVRRSEYDGWAARYRHVGSGDVNAIVTSVLQDLRTS